MPKYIVSVTVDVEKRYTVEADDEESAIDAAEEEAEDDDYGWGTHYAEIDVCQTRVVGYSDD